MLNVADPEQAFRVAQLPSSGVGLARMEFVISNHIRIHPMALVHFDGLRDEAARTEIEQKIGDFYQQQYPELASEKAPQITNAVAQLQEIYTNNIFSLTI